MTVYQVPLWSFLIYTAYILLTTFGDINRTDVFGAVLAVLGNLPFAMSVPIAIAMFRYRNYYLNYVLAGESLESLVIQTRSSGESH